MIGMTLIVETQIGRWATPEVSELKHIKLGIVQGLAGLFERDTEQYDHIVTCRCEKEYHYVQFYWDQMEATLLPHSHTIRR